MKSFLHYLNQLDRTTFRKHHHLFKSLLLSGAIAGTSPYLFVSLAIAATPTDFGDAPASYGTLLADNGARHIISGLYLGAGVTAETDGQPNATATGDANDDGVTFSPTLGANYSTVVQAGISNQVKVVSSGSGFVNAWVDYNQNGVFDSGEQILTNQAVVAGTNTLTFTPANTATHGSTFARFRLSPTLIASPSPLGLISGGEVEDYQVSVAAPVPNGAACTTTGLLNGSFENPIQSANTFTQNSQTTIPGWNTTASDQLIEIWSTPYQGVNAYSGNQFAEINATQVASLYQDIVTVPGSTLTFQFAHRARRLPTTGPHVVDTTAVKAGPPGATVQQGIYSTDSTDWVVYGGTYVVPAGQYITRFEFASISAGSGYPAVGNFIDDVRFSVNGCVTPFSPPTIDLDGNNSTATGNNYQNTFFVGGAAVAAADTDVVITDDKTNITRAIIQLTTTPDGTNESLTIDPTAGGTVTGVTVDLAYDSTVGASTTGRLTLKGSATLSDYQKVLATLKYSNTKASPTMSDRTINVQVIDSDKAISNTATSTIKMVVAKSISGTLYRDNDRSGTNNGEPGIGSIRVILYKDNDNNDEVDSTSEIIQQVNTLADGTYQFTNVPAGTYKIKVDIADTDVPLGYTLGTTDNLPVTVNTTNITGQDFGFYPALTCEWDAQLYTGHFPVAGQGGNDSVANGYYGSTGLPTLRGTAKFGTGIAKFTFNDQTINVNPPVHPLRTIINGSFPSQGYVPINGDYPLRTYGSTSDEPNWVIVFKRQALAKGRVTLGQTGAYIDDAMEIYLNGVRVGNPVLTYTTSLAANQVSTVSVNAGDIVEIRLTNFGYIGGFVVSTDFGSDFGDAPNSYGEVSQAPSCSNPHLGATVTGESSQTYSTNASGDAGDDGVTLPSSLTPGTTATIIVNASTAGFLNSWIDFNQNGVFDSGEQLNLTNVTKGTAATVNNVPLNAGNNTLTFTVPSNATVGSSFARFRFTASTVATPSPTGSGDAGEVEDYPVVITNPINISGTVFSDADADVTINGSDTGTNAGSANLTIYAIDTAGKVVNKATVTATGTYSLTNIPANSSVTLRLSNDNTVAIGATALTASSIPSGWYYTGENKNGTVDGTIATLGNIALTTTTSNLTNENFGIRQAYTITADPAPTTCNPDYRTALNTGITAAGGQLAAGANDLNWTAEWIAGPASGPGTPYAPPRPVGVMPAVVVGNLAPGAWVNEPANARWINYPFRLSVNGNGNHNNADLDGVNGEDGSGIAIVGTSDVVRLKFTSTLTLPSNANTISISLPVGVAIDNQFVSIKVNGVENLVPTPAANPLGADYGTTKTVNITNGWQAGVNTIEIVMDSGPPQAGFLLSIQATSTQVCGKSNVVLVKRITAINGVNTINPSDNTTHLDQVVDNPATPNDDATVKWPSGYLVGAFNAGKIKPGDVLEYTVYFLNAKGANANTVKICDRIIGSQTYKTSSLEIRLGNATSSISLSDAADPALDRGQFYPSSASAPAACNLITPGAGVADNGTWAVDVTGTGSSAQPDFTTMPSATAPGTPTASYGFIRFKSIVNP